MFRQRSVSNSKSPNCEIHFQLELDSNLRETINLVSAPFEYSLNYLLGNYIINLRDSVEGIVMKGLNKARNINITSL